MDQQRQSRHGFTLLQATGIAFGSAALALFGDCYNTFSNWGCVGAGCERAIARGAFLENVSWAFFVIGCGLALVTIVAYATRRANG